MNIVWMTSIFVLKGIHGSSHHFYPVKCKSENCSSVCQNDTYKELKRFVHYQIEKRIRDCNLQGCDTDQLIKEVTDISYRDIEYLITQKNVTDDIISTMSTSIGNLTQENDKLTQENDNLKKELADLKTADTSILTGIDTIIKDIAEFKSGVNEEIKDISNRIIPQGQVKKCPTKWKQFQNSCFYKNEESKKDWQSAQDFCMRLGARLAEFDNDKNLYDKVFNDDMITGSTWVGGNGYKPFQWSFLGTDINEAMFAKGEPNSNGELLQCIQIWYGNGLDDTSCQNSQHFLCEKKIASP